MRYANRLNAFEREAAHAAIRNRVIQPVLPNDGQAQQQQQLINGEIQIAQINEHHLQLQSFDRGVIATVTVKFEEKLSKNECDKNCRSKSHFSTGGNLLKIC